MTGVLSTEASKWAETVESNGEKALLSPLSAKNVSHVLSTATVRGPQKNLYSAAAPFFSKMMEDRNGVSILTSLTKYGTPKTVEGVAKELLNSKKGIWNQSEEPVKELAAPLGELLAAIVYREDCRADSCLAIVNSLSSASAEKLLSSAFTLPAAGRLFCLDAKFAARIARDEKGKRSLLAATASVEDKNAAIAFCDQILKADVGKESAAKYLFEVFFVPAPDGTRRPREEVILGLVANAPPAVVSKVGKVMLKWTGLRELLQREAFAKIFAEIILRADDAETARKIALALFDNVAEIDAMVTGRRKPHLRLLSVIDEKPTIVAALEKKMGTPLAGKLRGSKIRYTNATLPRATATQQAIMAKLERLRAGNASDASVSAKDSKQTSKSKKRARE